MINIENVKIMHELAVFRKTRNRHEELVESYFKSDYVTKHMLGSLFCYTICFVLVFLTVILCHLEEIINTIDFEALIEEYRPWIKYYCMGLVIYEIITIVIYSMRYSKAKRNERLYLVKLRKLNKKYERVG